MFVSRPSSCPRRRQRFVARLAAGMFAGIFGAAATLASSLILIPIPQAHAAEPPNAAEPDAAKPALGSTAFGVPRPTWYAPQFQIQLQPERARLMLFLPKEWMPAPDPGVLAAMGFSGVEGMDSLPASLGTQWVFHQRHSMLTATMATSVGLEISAPYHSVDFQLRLMPRAAIAVLRFDPTGRLH